MTTVPITRFADFGQQYAIPWLPARVVSCRDPDWLLLMTLPGFIHLEISTVLPPFAPTLGFPPLTANGLVNFPEATDLPTLALEIGFKTLKLTTGFASMKTTVDLLASGDAPV